LVTYQFVDWSKPVYGLYPITFDTKKKTRKKNKKKKKKKKKKPLTSSSL